MIIELPKIKHGKSGLVKRGKIWHVIYYEDGKMKTKSTKRETLAYAIPFRAEFHTEMFRKGARYKGDSSSVVQDAIDDPDGTACIYSQTTHRVVVGGTTLITTTDLEKAKQVRNQHIKENYEA